MRRALSSVALGLWAPLALGESPPVELTADQVALDAGAIEAAGEVVVDWDTWRLRASVLQVEESGAFRAENIWITPCRCESPPYALRAKLASGELGEQAVLSGGGLEICGKKVLPIPRVMVPLRERSTGLRLPRIGHGAQGLVLAQPIFLNLGEDADLTLAPEWRSQGALRLLGEGRMQTRWGPDARLGGAVGQDTWNGVARGMTDVDIAGAQKRARWGIDSTWQSDPRYLSDYGGDYLGRAAPWTESLAVAGVGPVRVESDTFGPMDGGLVTLAQRPVAGVLSASGQALGPLSANAMARVDMVTMDPDIPSGTTQRMAAAASMHAGHMAGPVQLETRAEGRWTQWADGTPWEEGRLWSAARLGLWGDVGAQRHLADLGVAGSVAGQLGEVDVRLPEDLPAPAWSIGPSLRSRWLSDTGVPVSMEAAVPWTEDGWQPTGTGRVQIGAWGSRLAGSSVLQETSTWWNDGRMMLGLGGVHYGALLQARGEAGWTLPAPVDAWRPGWRGLGDLHTGQLLSQGPTLTYDSPCDCLRLETAVTWAADRDNPEFWMRVDLR